MSDFENFKLWQKYRQSLLTNKKLKNELGSLVNAYELLQTQMTNILEENQNLKIAEKKSEKHINYLKEKCKNLESNINNKDSIRLNSALSSIKTITEENNTLKKVHLDKIAMSDAIAIINVDGYIGETIITSLYYDRRGICI